MNRLSRKISKSIFIGFFVCLVALLIGETAAFASSTSDFSGQPKTELRSLTVPAHLGGVPLRLEIKKQALSLSEIAAVVLVPGEIEVASTDHNLQNIDTMSTSAIIKGVFGSVAIPMSYFPVSTRWRPIFQNISQCAGKRPCLQNSASFQRVVQKSAGTGFRDKLSTMNKGVNVLVRYKSDRAVYGVADHWATPEETLARGVGDCEDFAILKMAGLSRSGIPLQSMSLVILQDKQRRVFHAVLSVATSQGTFILDNLSDRVLLDTELGNYQPLYSLSTDRAWIHGARSTDKKVASNSGEFNSIAPGEGVDQITNGASGATLLATTDGQILRQGSAD